MFDAGGFRAVEPRTNTVDDIYICLVFQNDSNYGSRPEFLFEYRSESYVAIGIY